MRRLFLDLDGVFADFDAHVESLLGKHPREFEPDDAPMWAELSKVPGFYHTMPKTKYADRLMEEFEHYRPIFLSGVPKPQRNIAWTDQDKRLWVQDHYPGTGVITCWSEGKSAFCRQGDVLLDDRDSYAHRWIAARGIFVLFRPVSETIEPCIADVHYWMNTTIPR